MIKRLSAKVEADGVSGLLSVGYRRALPRRLAGYRSLLRLFDGKTGLEIGGPSEFFRKRGPMPVYTVAATIDNCNFSDRTIWEGEIEEGETFHFDQGRAPGRQYVREASQLDGIPSSAYNFVLSSHTLEHVANPLQALTEWIRVLKAEGLLLLVVPHRDGTFDHRRPVTSLAHVVQDFENETSEDDLTHLEEILRLHDLSRDPWAGDLEAFRQRAMRNSENRSLHHHVFDTRFAIELIDHMGLQLVHVECVQPVHIVVMARKLREGQQTLNGPFTGAGTAPSWRSPFPSDRLPAAEPATSA
jgi:SAM-dependent methyltransferase